MVDEEALEQKNRIMLNMSRQKKNIAIRTEIEQIEINL